MGIGKPIIDKFLQWSNRREADIHNRVKVGQVLNHLSVVLPTEQKDELLSLMNEHKIACHLDGEGFGHSFFVIGGDHPPIEDIQEILDSVD